MTRRTVTPDEYELLSASARRVLATNQIDGRSSTLPAPGQYPHQWNWDSAFIAMGLAHIDEARACAELEALLEGQWGNGMVPHIIYNPDEVNDRSYFPQRWRWGTELAEAAAGPPTSHVTSGITQPPVLAIAAAYIAEVGADQALAQSFLRRVYPKLLAFHRYLLTERDPHREGLAFLIHPWESGLDNSPRWQSSLDAIVVNRGKLPEYQRLDTKLVMATQRPTNDDYDRYVYLLEVYKEHRYNHRLLFAHCPFLVQDVLFNALLHRANEALITIATALGEPTQEIEVWRERTADAFARKLWDEAEGRYFDFDLRAGRPIDQNTIATFLPLYAELPTAEQAERLVRGNLTNPAKYWPHPDTPHFVIPTASKDNAYWDPNRYWRGPIWINTNWLVLQGLLRYGYHEEARRIFDDTLSLLTCPLPEGEPWWFWEYFNPLNGNVYGIDRFSWSAALAIALTAQPPPGRRPQSA